MRAKISKKKEKQSVSKVNEMCKTQTLESGSSKRKKLNPTLSDPIYICFGPRLSHCVMKNLERGSVEERRAKEEEFEQGEQTFRWRGAHTRVRDAQGGHDASAASPQFKIHKGTMHSGRAAHWAWHVTHTTRCPKTLQFISNIGEVSESRGSP